MIYATHFTTPSYTRTKSRSYTLSGSRSQQWYIYLTSRSDSWSASLQFSIGREESASSAATQYISFSRTDAQVLRMISKSLRI